MGAMVVVGFGEWAVWGGYEGTDMVEGRVSGEVNG